MLIGILPLMNDALIRSPFVSSLWCLQHVTHTDSVALIRNDGAEKRSADHLPTEQVPDVRTSSHFRLPCCFPPILFA